MANGHDDLVELSRYAWQRLRDRMAGLTDEEYGWEPVPGCRTVRPVGGGRYRSDGPARRGDRRVFTTLSWRLAHIIDLLREERNAIWLGVAQPAAEADGGDPGTAAEALAGLDAAYDVWRRVLAATTDESLGQPIGAVAGPYGEATRRSLVLHVLDELIHHGAEAALLRDLYAASRSAPTSV